MKKIILLIILVSLIHLSGCVTTSIWEDRRQQLTDAYNRGEISAEFYYQQISQIDQQQQNARQNYQENLTKQQELRQKNQPYIPKPYYLPPLQTKTNTNCNTKCDASGNCHTTCY